MSTCRAIAISRSVSFSGRPVTKSQAAVIERVETCQMFRPSTVTARISGLSRLPSQVGHGRATMYRSSSDLMNSDSVSR